LLEATASFPLLAPVSIPLTLTSAGGAVLSIYGGYLLQKHVFDSALEVTP
jgi:hypothetical protein